jgi:hypothetical protein
MKEHEFHQKYANLRPVERYTTVLIDPTKNINFSPRELYEQIKQKRWDIQKAETEIENLLALADQLFKAKES